MRDNLTAVTVSSPVDGRVRRRSTGGRRRLATRVESFTVDPRVMAAARAALRPGQRLVIVSADVVRLVNA